MLVAYSLTQCAHPVPGGTAVAALELRKALLNRAAEGDVEPIEILSVGAQRGRVPAPLALPEPSVRFRSPYPLLYDTWNRSERNGFDRLAPNADVVHLTLALCPARKRVPQVCTVHDMFPVTHPDVLTARGANVLSAGLDRVFQRADLIAVPSQATADEVMALGAVSSERLRVVPWGADPVEFTDAELAAVSRRLGLPDSFVMFAGTLEPRKNLDVLLAALDTPGNSAHLVIVGPAGWGDVASRVSRVASDRLHLLGSLERRDLLAVMTRANALCMPSLAEGFGLPVLEAMAQGTPVIHSECAALSEVAGETGSVAGTTDVQAWANQMMGFTQEHARSVEIGLAAAKRAAEFTWARSARDMRRVYEELR